MRLTKIKLAGFKSFVDPTTIPIPSNLVGIVGPNGCGKSNTIDAVRWVMGESSAKNLRGDAMSDVIFNGSTARKPVGQASVEMFFDNSEGRAGGPYSQYSEISVRRVVTRDGTSNYFLNGTKCRRRDITDLFLGTGLGPRSYSIIEQGMISRLIEARPEDLRVFLEEAAGISKYKERRRETETRIRHTRENLERLSDLREELDKQLSHLQRQAKNAAQYKELKEQERRYRGQLFALRWRDLDEECRDAENQISKSDRQAEALVATQRALEAQIESLREESHGKNEQFNEVQGRFYSLGSETARIEQQIQHFNERRSQQQQELAQLEDNYQELAGHIETDREKIEALTVTLNRDQALHDEQLVVSTLNAESLLEAEATMQGWQSEWEALNQRSNVPTQQAEVARAHMQQLTQTIAHSERGLQRLQQELLTLPVGPLECEVEGLHLRQGEQQAEVDDLRSSLGTIQSKIELQRNDNIELSDRLDLLRSHIQSQRGRQASLEALQQAALGLDKDELSQWLEGNGLADAQRIAQGINVDEGWEHAVECVLGFNLEAVCVEDIAPLAAALDGLNRGSLALFDGREGAARAPVDLPRLIDHVSAMGALEPLLGSVYTAANITDALSMRERLAAHESVITREGVWLGPNWLRVTRNQDEKASILKREQALESLKGELNDLNAQAEELTLQLNQGRESLQLLETQREAVQQESTQLNQQLTDLLSQLSASQTRLEQRRNRIEQVLGERAELQQQCSNAETEYRAAEQSLNAAMVLVAQLAEQQESLAAQREVLRKTLDEAKLQARVAREAVHEIALRVQSTRSTLQSTEQGLVRMQDQLTHLLSRREELSHGAAQEETLILLKTNLEQQLAARATVEAELAEVRCSVDEIEYALREKSSARSASEQQVQQQRDELEQLRLAAQALQLRRQAMLEKINETGCAFPQLFDEMPKEADEAHWQRQLDTIESRIKRLGAINLAAISEYEEQSERKRYLDEQDSDLNEALETLTSAIAKIDRETRARFKQTFDKVNEGLQANFPKLFGGGEASLALTGDDLLSTGVTVMASPPGKRNSTIHLLSGGEKALTAVALVFSIFELNPAPFCMLDEVDAPLDEANVGRFCKMVEAMSECVQFIFISHNKVTMEMAQQLNGVTMSEPGVSRLVAVDIQEAVEMASA